MICMAFTSFSCLLALASIFNALLDNSGVGRHPWIVLSLRKKAFCHWPLSIMLAASLFIYFFVDTLHQVEEVLLYCYYSEITFLKLWMGVEFCQLLFLQHWFNYVIFFFFFFSDLKSEQFCLQWHYYFLEFYGRE